MQGKFYLTGKEKKQKATAIKAQLFQKSSLTLSGAQEPVGKTRSETKKQNSATNSADAKQDLQEEAKIEQGVSKFDAIMPPTAESAPESKEKVRTESTKPETQPSELPAAIEQRTAKDP
jgi:hypothetical protein